MCARVRRRLGTPAAATLLLAAAALGGAPGAQALSRPVSGALAVGDDAGNAGSATVTGFADVDVVPTVQPNADLVFNDSRFDAGTIPLVYHEAPPGNPDDTSWIDIAFSLAGTAHGTLGSQDSQTGWFFDLTGMVLSLDEGLMEDVQGLERDFASEPLDFVLPATSVFVAFENAFAPRFTLPIEAQADVAGWGTMVASGSLLVPEASTLLLLASATLLAGFRLR